MIIDTLERLHYQLQKDKQSTPNQSLFLLLENQIQTELIQNYFLLDDTPEYRPLFLGTHLEEHIQHSPYIIQATPSTLAFIEWFFTHSQHWGFLYFSSHTIDDALSHWQKSILPSASKKTNPQYLLRLYDTKVLNAIISSPYHVEIRNILTPCSFMYFQNNNNQWVRQKNSEFSANDFAKTTKETSDHEAQQDPKTNLINALDSHSRFALYTPTIAKRCELLLWDKRPDLIEKLYPPMRKSIIEQGVEMAHKANLTEPQHLLAFLVLWLENGPNAITAPACGKQLVDSTISQEEKFRLLEEINSIEGSWNQVDLNLFNLQLI